MKVRFKKLNPDAVIPTRAHATDAGYDLLATSVDYADGVFDFGTGLAIEIPEGYAGFVFPRSSVYKYNYVMANSVGVIDSGYRGEIHAKFYLGRKDKVYSPGDRVAQLIIMPVPTIEFVEADKLSDSEPRHRRPRLNRTMKEIPLYKTGTINGIEVVCRPVGEDIAHPCSGCAFINLLPPECPPCFAHLRSDRRSVKFIKLKRT